MIKHAKATQAVITLRLEDPVRLTVADNGVGFDPSTVTADHPHRFGDGFENRRTGCQTAGHQSYSPVLISKAVGTDRGFAPCHSY
jgi:signal transduction histidine kinase